MPKDDRIVPCIMQFYQQELEQRGASMQTSQQWYLRLSQIVEWLQNGSKRGLLLTGNCGTGKSILLKSILHTLEFYNGKPLKTTYTGMALPVFFNAIDMSRDANVDGDAFHLVCKHYPVLAVDDVGTEPEVVKRFGMEATPIAELIYTRYEVQKPTIIATNLTMDELECRYGERAADRLYEMYERIVFDWSSFRRNS